MPESIEAPLDAPDLVVVGAASRDLSDSDPRGWTLGGGISYAALLAARAGLRVGALIGLDADARDASELQLLRDAGVDVRAVPLERGPVFTNVITAHGRFQLSHGTSDAIPPEALPGAWRAAPWVLLAPVAGEVPGSWADAVTTWRSSGGGGTGARPAVAVAWQGLLRGLEPERPVEHLRAGPDPLFALADIASVSSEDLRAGSDALSTLVPHEGQELVVTSGAGGPLHLRRLPEGFEVRAYPIVPVPEAVDTTGAGDAFLVGWLVARIRGGANVAHDDSLAAEMLAAANLASLTVQGVGLAGVPDADAVRSALAAAPPAE